MNKNQIQLKRIISDLRKILDDVNDGGCVSHNTDLIEVVIDLLNKVSIRDYE